MLNPKTVNMYVPVLDDVAREFVEITRACRDENNETPKNYGNYIQRLSLQAMATIALDTRLNVMDPNAENKGVELVHVMDNILSLSYQLDVMPSMWRYIRTPTLNRMMKSVDRRTR